MLFILFYFLNMGLKDCLILYILSSVFLVHFQQYYLHLYVS